MDNNFGSLNENKIYNNNKDNNKIKFQILKAQ